MSQRAVEWLYLALTRCNVMAASNAGVPMTAEELDELKRQLIEIWKVEAATEALGAMPMTKVLGAMPTVGQLCNRLDRQWGLGTQPQQSKRSTCPVATEAGRKPMRTTTERIGPNAWYPINDVQMFEEGKAMYYVIKMKKDEVWIREVTREGLSNMLAPSESGEAEIDGAQVMGYFKEGAPRHWKKQYLIIRGEIIVPKPVEVVKEWGLP